MANQISSSLVTQPIRTTSNQELDLGVNNKTDKVFTNFNEGKKATITQSIYYKGRFALRTVVRFLSGKVTVLFKKTLYKSSNSGFSDTAFETWNPNRISLENTRQMTPYQLAKALGFAKNPDDIIKELNNVPTRVIGGKLYKGEHEGTASTFNSELGLDEQNAETNVSPFTEALSLDAGVSQGYCVGTHSMMVVRIFDKHLEKKFEKVNNIVSIEEFRLFLMLHDIGKGLAVKEEGQFETKLRKQKELLYCQQAIDKIVNKEIIDERKGRIFKALLEDVTIGKFITKKINIGQAKDDLNHAFNKHNLENIEVTDFLRLSKIFHIADAGAYKSLRQIESLFQINTDGKVRHAKSEDNKKEFAGDKLKLLKLQLKNKYMFTGL